MRMVGGDCVQNVYCRSMCSSEDVEWRSVRGCEMHVVRAMQATGRTTPSNAKMANDHVMSHTSQDIFLQRKTQVAARPAER